MKLKTLTGILVILSLGLFLALSRESSYFSAKVQPERSPYFDFDPEVLPTFDSKVSPTPVPSFPAGYLFYDDFQTDLSNWGILKKDGEAKINFGSLELRSDMPSSVTASNTVMILAGDTGWKNYRFSGKIGNLASLRTDNPSSLETGWIMFRFQNSQNYYFIISNRDKLELRKVFNGAESIVASSDKKTNLDWQDFTIELKGSSIKVSFDGNILINVNDNEPLLMGKIGLATQDAKASFKSINVTGN